MWIVTWVRPIEELHFDQITWLCMQNLLIMMIAVVSVCVSSKLLCEKFTTLLHLMAIQQKKRARERERISKCAAHSVDDQKV